MAAKRWMGRAEKIKVDIARVRMPASVNVTFEQLLKDARGKTIQDRTVDLAGTMTRMERLDVGKLGGHEVELIRHRVEVPYVVQPGKPAKRLELQDDQDLGEPTVFAYRPEARTILIMRNRYALTSLQIAAFFQHHLGTNDPILFLPILRADVVKRLHRLTSVRKIEISVDDVAQPGLFIPKGESVAKFLALSEELQAPKVTATFSVGRRRGSMLVQRAIESVLEFLNASNSTTKVTKLLVHGTSDAVGLEELDLLEERVADVAEVALGAERAITFDAFCQGLRAVWGRQEKELVEGARP